MRVRLRQKRLVELLAQSNLSQNHWAIKMGLSRGHWSEIVNGKHPYPSPKTRTLMIETFGVPLKELFEIESGSTPESDAGLHAAIADRYLIDKELGQGGMGTVYLARDVKHGRLVALKVVSAEAVSGIGNEQFLKEIRSTAVLQHHNILPLFDSGEAAGFPYYVMPYIRAGSLRDLLNSRQSLPVDETIRFVRGVGAALQYAHDRQKLHCDVKPENILLSDDHAFVADFGISRAIHAEAFGWGKRDQIDSSAGTPAYVSPEQAAGERHLDSRSDVYSLACMTYEMLSGEPPFVGTTTMEVVSRRFLEVVPNVRDVAPHVPQRIAAVISSAMDVEPKRRPDSVGEFTNGLAAAATEQRSVLVEATGLALSRSMARGRRFLGLEGRSKMGAYMQSVLREIRHAVRTLTKSPIVTTVAVLSLALGIGTNTAMFSLFDQMLMQALPVEEPERLVNFRAPGPHPGSTSCNQSGSCQEVFSYPMFRDLEQVPGGFSGIAAHRAFSANLAQQNQTTYGQGVLVSGSYFPVLGIRPVLGRLLRPTDDEVIGENFVAVLSHSYWANNLGRDTEILNQTIMVNGHSMTIVGVAAREFNGTTMGAEPDVFVPISMQAQMRGGFDRLEDRRDYWAYLFGRLSPSTTLEQAGAEINAVYRSIINEVEAPLQVSMSDQTMERFRAKEISFEEGWRGQSVLFGEVRTPLALLFIITGVVLLIACANIANLLLAQGANRSQEMAVRASLGASRFQLLSQLLTHSCLLAILGGVASLVIAQWTISIVASILPAESSNLLTPDLRPSVVVFAALVSLGTGFLFGMYPALNSTRSDLITLVRAGSGQPSGARAAARFRNSLVTAQIGLSMALLITAGTFIKSLYNVSRVDLGLDIENVVTFGVSPVLNGYEPEDSQILFGRLEEELAALPGVTGVSAAIFPYFTGNSSGTNVSVEGFESGPDTDRNSRYNVVGAEFFNGLSIPLLAGREFRTSDAPGAPRVAIINEAFARKFGLSDREAVGKWMSRSYPASDLDIQIVGLIGDTKSSDVKQETPALYFMPYRQTDWVGSMTFYVRTGLATNSVMQAIPTVVKDLDANLPVEDLKTFEQQVSENVVLDRLNGTLSALFAALATVLAAVGLYGVLAYTVALRTREFGLRMALGANNQRVRSMVLWQVGRMTIVGGVLGIATGLVVCRAARSLLYGYEGLDLLLVASVAILLSLVALGAGYVPALRASRADPMEALRYE